MITFLRRISLTWWIIIALIVGIAYGALFPKAAVETKVVSDMFLNLIKCIIVPLILSTLIVGISGHTDDMKAMGRLALKSIIYFEIVTTLALFLGLGAVNLVKPGANVKLSGSAELGEKLAQKKATVSSFANHLAPSSFFNAAAENDVLGVVIFTIIFAVALTQVKGKSKQVMLDFFEAVSEVMFKFTNMVMCLAPLGVGAAIAATIGASVNSGEAWHEQLRPLGKLVLTLYGALVVFIVVVLIPVMLIARIPILRFFKAVRQPALLAFTTASSEVALPDALRTMEKFGVPKRIVSFVLPTGYSFNLDGSTLYLALASVFVAQAAGIELSFGVQLQMMLTLMLTSKGVAAVPRASLVILSATLATFGLPAQGVAVIMAVDAFMDMARTSINLLGNCLASAVVARWEGELNIPPEGADSKANT